MYNKLLVFSVVFTLFLLISGCSSDDTTGPDDPGTGSFNATITGYYEKDISGISVFGSAIDEEFDEEAFLIAMMTDQEDMSTGDYIWMGRIGATRPGTGTYQIGNPDDIEDDEWNPEHFYLAYWSFNEENGEHTGGFFWSTSGSVTISTSTSSRVAGNFSVEAEGYTWDDTEDDEKTININGTFDSVGGDVITPY